MCVLEAWNSVPDSILALKIQIWYQLNSHMNCRDSVKAQTSPLSYGWSWWEKPEQKYGKKFFPTFKFVFLLENPTHWGSETALCPSFVKPVLDIFAVCSMVLRMNLFYTQQSHFMPKKSKLPTKEDWFKVFP